MRKVVWFLTLLLVAGLVGDAAAQTVAIKGVGMSAGLRKILGYSSSAPTSTGLRVFGKQEKVYLEADTAGSGANTATSFQWSIQGPPGSSVTLDSTDKIMTSFTGNDSGKYYVTLTVNGSVTAHDTLFASTYNGFIDQYSCACHMFINTDRKLETYPMTGHATQFYRGITGQLEVNTHGEGAYAPTCIRCHTTGYNVNAKNGNFGYLAHAAGWDTTWTKGLKVDAGDVMIEYQDSTIWNNLQTNYPQLMPLAKIGCESCHGPATDHRNTGNPAYIDATMNADVCMQCHDSPTHHSVGAFWKESNHSTMVNSGEEASRSSCYPCHNASSFVAFAANKAAPDYSHTVVTESISCQVCHDPHSAENPGQLRTVTLDSLPNGYVPPAGRGGVGQLCMNCHRGRESTAKRVAAQMKKWSDRFYPHNAPQADMYLGANAYEYGLNITGIGTHHGVENACVTCHMSKRLDNLDHSMKMDSSGVDKVTACRQCHGNINTFEDIQAAADYDGNGRIESAVAEIQGLLAELKAVLPKGSDGEPINSTAEYNKDSLEVKANPNNYPAIWNYYFVVKDGSNGIHNTKYAAAILRASLTSLTGIQMADQEVPRTFDLSQNYPNPFNPSTEIKFSLPRAAHIDLVVFNVLGEHIATLAGGDLAPGNYTATWNGRDRNGANVASGVYFYRLVIAQKNAPQQVITKKMILMK